MQRLFGKSAITLAMGKYGSAKGSELGFWAIARWLTSKVEVGLMVLSTAIE